MAALRGVRESMVSGLADVAALAPAEPRFDVHSFPQQEHAVARHTRSLPVAHRRVHPFALALSPPSLYSECFA